MNTAVVLLVVFCARESLSLEPHDEQPQDVFNEPVDARANDVSLKNSKPGITEKPIYEPSIIEMLNLQKPVAWMNKVLKKVTVKMNDLVNFAKETYDGFLIVGSRVCTAFSLCEEPNTMTSITTREPPTYEEYKLMHARFKAERRKNKTLHRNKDQEEREKRWKLMTPDEVMAELEKMKQTEAKTRAYNTMMKIKYLEHENKGANPQDLAELLQTVAATITGGKNDTECTGAHEVLMSCTDARWEHCNERFFQEHTYYLCTTKCFCEDGYYRNPALNNSCVPVAECPDEPCPARPNQLLAWCHEIKKSDKCANRNSSSIDKSLKSCRVTCVCQNGYLKTHLDNCVLETDCPEVACAKRPNEEWRSCEVEPDWEVCDDRYNLGKPTSCFLKCVCKNGYKRNLDYDCIPEEECPNILCSTNGDGNLNGVLMPCRKRTGSDSCEISLTSTSIQTDHSETCPPKCMCDLGYWRNDTNHCVLYNKCPEVICSKRPNEVWRSCAKKPFSWENCDERHNPGTPEKCIPKCVCIVGYWRNGKNLCVTEHKCEDRQCTKKNEVWRSCRETPYWDMCADRYKTGHPTKCIRKCVCKSGYWRNEENECVVADKCGDESCSPKLYEVWTPCSKRTGSDRCEDRKKTPPAPTKGCPLKCMCKIGYWKNHNDDCVPENECNDVICTKLQNEEWRTCGNTTKPEWENCDDRYRTGHPVDCIPKCACIKGHFRDKTGVCVRMENCPDVIICFDNSKTLREVLTLCGKRLSDRCEDRLNKTISTIIDPSKCPPKCMCQTGYWRNDINDCVSAEECNDELCAKLPNEEWRDCRSIAAWEKCEDRYNLIKPSKCTRKCVCKKGFWRNKENHCVAEQECHEVACIPSKENEIMTSCTESIESDRCDDRWNVTSLKQASKDCKPKCMCKKEYWRNVTGQCVPEDECDDLTCVNLLNEEWRTCKGRFDWERCEERFNTEKPVKSCTRKCVCKEGYFRNENNVCVAVEKCPDLVCTPFTGNDNEVMTLCSIRSGSEKCDDRFNLTATKPDPSKDCQSKCMCKIGYWRNENNDCVLSNKCPDGFCSLLPNKEWRYCTSDPKWYKCEDWFKTGLPDACQCLSCIQMCVCKEGFWLNGTNDCVPPEECPVVDCFATSLNEAWIPCSLQRKSDHCADKTSSKLVGQDPRTCTPKCMCKEGYWRNNLNNKCVPENECDNDLCSKLPNEEWANCKEEQNWQSCTEWYKSGSPDKCTRKCVCKKGYYRNKDKKCVSVEECPDVNCVNSSKSLNQVWTPCSKQRESDLCKDRLNSSLSTQTDCSPQCMCKEGHWRNNEGNCVPLTECDDEICDSLPNEEWTSCKEKPRWEKCEDRFKTTQPKECIQKCVCKNGFWRNETNDCIPEQECPVVSCTGKSIIGNEGLTKCIDRRITDRCEERNNVTSLGSNPPKDCRPECMCIEKYWRNHADNCVPFSECDQEICARRLNEEWTNCTNGMTTQNCADRFMKLDNKCTPKCVCKAGHYRNKQNVCFPEDKCGDVVCHNHSRIGNEIWTSCSKQRESDWCEDRENSTLTALYNSTSCAPRCMCKPGYFKDDGKNCVVPSRCDAEICPQLPNEEWRDCKSKPNWENCGDWFKSGHPNTDCVRKCVCKKGFWRNELNVCVLLDKCPPIPCPTADGVLTPCSVRAGSDTCEDGFNSNFILKQNFSNTCIFNCLCNVGFWRKEGNNMCVTKEECEDVICSKKPNEEWTRCRNNHTWELCDDRFNLNEPPKCIHKCVCKEGYWRNDNVCIKREECPDIPCFTSKTQNELVTPCNIRTGSDLCEDRNLTAATPSNNCRAKCMCKIGYWRNLDNDCVPLGECDDELCSKYPNEEWRDCKSKHTWEKCADMYNLRKPPKCTRKCVCKTGFWRNELNTCIPEKECPIVPCVNTSTSLHQVWTPCSVQLESDLCKDRKKKTSVQNLKDCAPKCMCKTGYWRNVENDCVPLEQCEDVICSKHPNEVWTECTSKHDWQNCNEWIKPGQDNSCTRKCVCQKGYFRAYGICVPLKKCPDIPCFNKPNSLNEVQTGCSDQRLSEKCDDRKTNASRKNSNDNCLPKCMCKLGYWRNDEDKCVEPHDCEDSVCARRKNEVWRTCTNKNLLPTWDDCDNWWEKGRPDCTRKCVCKQGFYRNKNGTCVPFIECPEKACDNTGGVLTPCSRRTLESCEEGFKVNYTEPEFSEGVCETKCTCKPGYWRNDENICIKWKDCLQYICSLRQNEELRSCKDMNNYYVYIPYAVQPKYLNIDRCDERGGPYPTTCKRDCMCKKGYLRNADGICIPEQDCSPKICRGELMWKTCKSYEQFLNCGWHNAHTFGSKYECWARCQCPPGHYMGADLKCYNSSECWRFTERYENWSAILNHKVPLYGIWEEWPQWL